MLFKINPTTDINTEQISDVQMGTPKDVGYTVTMTNDDKVYITVDMYLQLAEIMGYHNPNTVIKAGPVTDY